MARRGQFNGAVLARLRRSQRPRMTQAALAKEIAQYVGHCSRQTISKAEHPTEGTLGPEMIEAAAKVFGTTADVFYRKDEAQTKLTAPEQRVVDIMRSSAYAAQAVAHWAAGLESGLHRAEPD